jgi:hypothetical protein
VDWIVVGFSIHFEKWIWIWISNHIFVMDLDWIDNKKNRIEQQPGYILGLLNKKSLCYQNIMQLSHTTKQKSSLESILPNFIFICFQFLLLGWSVCIISK